jgi:ABC-type multidrug transport system fused ATPase/permease subunit
MVFTIICGMAMMCGLIGFYRQNNFLSILNDPNFSGDLMRMYFVYTEMYYILNLTFSGIATYMVFDDAPVISSVVIGIIVMFAIPRISTVISFLTSASAGQIFEDRASELMAMKRKFAEDDKCEK